MTKTSASLLMFALPATLAHALTASVTIDYPLEGSLFPPEITPPTFLFRDTAPARHWRIDIAFGTNAQALHRETQGEHLRLGEIDPRCISSTNELPKLTPVQATMHTWRPDEATWEVIKRQSVAEPATVTITRIGTKGPVSSGRVHFQTSADPVGAPIFFRTVPLMPSETEKGVIKPLAQDAIGLIQWVIRDLAKPASRVVLTDMPTCANCHSFSLDGKTVGMDMDGPFNDKGLYALADVKPYMSIRSEDLIAWDHRTNASSA